MTQIFVNWIMDYIVEWSIRICCFFEIVEWWMGFNDNILRLVIAVCSTPVYDRWTIVFNYPFLQSTNDRFERPCIRTGTNVARRWVANRRHHVEIGLTGWDTEYSFAGLSIKHPWCYSLSRRITRKRGAALLVPSAVMTSGLKGPMSFRILKISWIGMSTSKNANGPITLV